MKLSCMWENFHSLFNHLVHEGEVVFCVNDSVHYFTVSPGGLPFLNNTFPEDVQVHLLLGNYLKFLIPKCFSLNLHIAGIFSQQFQKLYSLWKKLISCQIPSILKITNRKSAESNLHTDMKWIYTISDSFIPYKYPDRNLKPSKT